MKALPTTRRTRGFTLVEVLITAMILGTAFVAATWSMSATARTKAAYDEIASPAPFLAQEIFNLADGLPRAPSGDTGATSGAGVAALDSLVGANFSPAILADGSVAPGYAGWSQQVSLSVWDVADLSAPTNLDPCSGLSAEGPHVYRLDVAVRHDGQLEDTFSWWLNP